MIVWNLSVLGWIAWLHWVAWFAVLWSPAWNFWNLAVHDLGWVRWISFIRNWVGPWNWVTVRIYRYDAAVWSVDNGVAAVWIIRSYGLAAHALLVGSVSWLYWSRYFSVLVLFWIPSSRGFTSDFVLGGLASEGCILLILLGLDYLAVLVLVDVGYGLLARYRSLTRSHGVIQPNNEDLTWINSIITIMNGVELSLRCWNSVSEQVIPTVKVGLQLRISRAKVNGLPRLPLQLNVNKGAVLGIINKPY